MTSTMLWQQNNACYEIHSWILEDMDLETLLPHWLNIREEILAVSQNEDQNPDPLNFPSFQEHSPSVRLGCSRGRWLHQKSRSFDEALVTFIASHCTTEEMHELVRQLHHQHKPRDITNVQPFYYRLLKLNSYIELIPGMEVVGRTHLKGKLQ
jgi:hypothetical protein